eukprot:scaffold170486_cov33-Tisochrysis_lutea.AAC.1
MVRRGDAWACNRRRAAHGCGSWRAAGEDRAVWLKEDLARRWSGRPMRPTTAPTPSGRRGTAARVRRSAACHIDRSSERVPPTHSPRGV